MPGWLAAAICLAVLAVFPFPSPAGDHDRDHQRAWTAVREGKIEPLTLILSKVEERYSGEVLKVEFTDEVDAIPAGFYYRIRILTARGRVVSLEIDAHSLEIFNVYGRQSVDGVDC